MKKLAIIVCSVIVIWMTFVGGRKSGFQEAIRIGDLKAQSINALNAMGSYDVHADTAKDIEAGNSAKALCSIQIYASAKVMQVRQCLEDPSCKSLIESEVQKVAPELLGNGALKLKFFKLGEKCAP
jgi:hypothetical protein